MTIQPAAADDPNIDHAWIEDTIGDLTLAEKCKLLAGKTSWRTHAVDHLGVPQVKMSDGPNGIRGEGSGTDRTPSVVVPVGIVQGATWDPALVERVGDLLGKEAVRKGAHVALAPAVNLHRTPIGGRTFEYHSEDPELTAALAAATVRGIQRHHVAVTVKHFVANDSEVERNSVNAVVDETTLRELYLRPFEAAVVEAGAWGIMSAYNQLNGDFCAANDRLLNEILRREWGFDGFVVSDWFGAHDPTGSANGGLSIEMPGPARVYGEHLESAVEAGGVDEATVDSLVRDLLVLIERTNARSLSADRDEQTVEAAEELALVREVAIAGTVLLTNRNDTLPLDAGALSSVAIIGPNAEESRVMGGGSSALKPLRYRNIRQSLTDRLEAAGVAVTYEKGCSIDKNTPLPKASSLRTPDGAEGLAVQFLQGDDRNEVTYDKTSDTTMLVYFGSVPSGVDATSDATLRIRGSYIPSVTGPQQFGAIITDVATITIGGETMVDLEHRRDMTRGEMFYGIGSGEYLLTVDGVVGEPLPIEVDLRLRNANGGIRLGVSTPVVGDPIQRAVDAAAAADAVVLVVGTNDEWETEGHDRDTISLPGDQDELVRRVAAVNQRTVVVVNAGSPVALPWADEVGAIIDPFFGGMEMGDAVTDVLVGDADPGGRLPTSFPHRLEDAPGWEHYAPVGGVQTYGEGLLIGYRGYDAEQRQPHFAFGHGLSYGTATWGAPLCPAADVPLASLEEGDEVTVTTHVANDGERPVTVVVQGYVAPSVLAEGRAPKTLQSWAKVTLAAGEEAHVDLPFGFNAFRRWDPATEGWVVEPGEYELVVARSASDEHERVTVTII